MMYEYGYKHRVRTVFEKCSKVVEIENDIFQDLESFGK